MINIFIYRPSDYQTVGKGWNRKVKIRGKRGGYLIT